MDGRTDGRTDGRMNESVNHTWPSVIDTSYGKGARPESFLPQDLGIY